MDQNGNVSTRAVRQPRSSSTLHSCDAAVFTATKVVPNEAVSPHVKSLERWDALPAVHRWTVALPCGGIGQGQLTSVVISTFSTGWENFDLDNA